MNAPSPVAGATIPVIRHALIDAGGTDDEDNAHGAAVYRHDGTVLDTTVRIRGDTEHRPPATVTRAYANAAPGRLPDAAYLGHFSFHFGHFLCETLPMLRFVKALPDDMPLVFHRMHGERRSLKELLALPWVDAFLNAAGVAAGRVLMLRRGSRDPQALPPNVVRAPLRVRTLHVPPRIDVSMQAADAAVAAFFTAVGDAIAGEAGAGTAASRIYLTRRFLKSRHLDNEEEIERWFADRGFTIVAPETLPLCAQIALVRQAGCIAGTDGSALHLGLFARPGTHMILLGTREGGELAIRRANTVQGLRTVSWAIESNLEVSERKDDGQWRAARMIGVAPALDALWRAAPEEVQRLLADPGQPWEGETSAACRGRFSDCSGAPTR